MKVLILGHGGHGKDTAAEIIHRLYGLTYCSSSWFAMERAVYPHLEDKYPGSTGILDCFDDRANMRQQWHDLILAYNTPDRARLVRELLVEHDMYVGLRNDEEFVASRHLFDLIIWVDAGNRLPPEASMRISYDPDMVLLNNNGSKAWLEVQIEGLRSRFAFADAEVEV